MFKYEYPYKKETKLILVYKIVSLKQYEIVQVRNLFKVNEAKWICLRNTYLIMIIMLMFMRDVNCDICKCLSFTYIYVQ